MEAKNVHYLSNKDSNAVSKWILDPEIVWRNGNGTISKSSPSLHRPTTAAATAGS